MKIGGFQKFSLMDYPEKIACIVFTQGCDFKCGYCHNPELIELSANRILQENIIDFLKQRQGKLDAVVITGGEPTIQSSLADFIATIKNLGFLVKLDTNGSNPFVIEKLLDLRLLDYIAMDIKAPFDKYKDITNSKINVNYVKKSIEIIKKSSLQHEFRTTVVKEQLSINDILEIASYTKGSKHYFQKFVYSKNVDLFFKNKSTYSDKEFEEINALLKENNYDCEIR